MASYYEILMGMGVAQTPLPSSGVCTLGVYVGSSYCPPAGAVMTTPPPCEKGISECDDDEIKCFLERFQTAYPEVKISLHQDPDNPDPGLDYYIMVCRRLDCLYPRYACIHDICAQERFFLLLAHYLVTLEKNPGEYNANTVASVSTGDASISYNTEYSNSLAKNPFFLWLSRSPYGNALLMYIKSQQGYPIIV